MAGSSGKDDVYGARNRSAHDLADVVGTGHEKRRWRLPELRLVSGVWRAGIDLNPLDVADPDDVHWLSCLVWPGRATGPSGLPQLSNQPARTRRLWSEAIWLTGS